MINDPVTKSQIEATLKALDAAIETGPWEESNFLRVIKKKLITIRDNFATKTGYQTETEQKNTAEFLKQIALRQGQQEIFIGIYSSDGNNMQAWERLLMNLPRQIISRPIYANEQDIKNLIKSKENKINEAYVVAYVSKTDILNVKTDKIPLDRFGKPLLSLKDKCLYLENISRFVHLSTPYSYVKGHLIKSIN